LYAGVRYENGNGPSETIAADLVVDASGRGAPTLALLRSIGCPLPEETTIGIDLGYATCVYAIPDDAPTEWKGIRTFAQAPQYRRGGIMLPLEGNRWMVTLGGRHGDVPPGDAEGVPTYARSLRTPTIYNAIRHAKPLDGVARYGFPESVRRHVERLDVFPRGLLPIGDAICRGRSAVRVLSGRVSRVPLDTVAVRCIRGPPGTMTYCPPARPTCLPSATETRRAIVLILHDSSKAATTQIHDWTPKGLCKS
jgi:hypothetical protein